MAVITPANLLPTASRTSEAPAPLYTGTPEGTVATRMGWILYVYNISDGNTRLQLELLSYLRFGLDPEDPEGFVIAKTPPLMLGNGQLATGSIGAGIYQPYPTYPLAVPLLGSVIQSPYANGEVPTLGQEIRRFAWNLAMPPEPLLVVRPCNADGSDNHSPITYQLVAWFESE